MKKTTLLLLFTVIAIAIVATFYFSKNNNKQIALGGANAEMHGEDVQGRLQWEHQRLADPATGTIPLHIRQKELAFASTLPNDEMDAAKLSSQAIFTNRGPHNVGGRTRALAIDVTNENILLAGSCSGGIWRSTDGGATWSMTSTLGQLPNITSIAQDTRTGHTLTWYASTGEGYGASASASGAYYLGNGIYKSTDGGLTWSILPSTSSNTPQTFDLVWDIIWRVVIDPNNLVNDVVYASTYGSIYKSTNGGTSWTKVLGSTVAYAYFTDINITSTGIIYATLSSDGTQKGIFRSTDGITFTAITPTVAFPATYNRFVIGIDPNNENTVYFLGNTPGFGQPDTNFLGTVEWNSIWKYTYISGNGSGTGGAWMDLSANLPTTGGMFDKFQSQGSYDLTVKVKPGDSTTVFIGGTNLYRSTSAFADSSNTTFIGGYEEGASLPVVNSYINHHPDQHDIIFLPSNPNIMFSANDGGIFKTMDNTASPIIWGSLNTGYVTSMFYTTAIDHAATNDNVIIGGSQDNGSWFTNSAIPTDPWVSPRGGDGSYCAIADNKSAYYFSIQNGKMMKADVDANGNVLNFARIDPIGGTGYQFINPYSIDPNNNNMMYLAGGKYLWRNNDLSGIPYLQNWDSIATNWIQFPDSMPVTNAKITAVAVSKTPANRVYIGTSSHNVYRIDNANTGTPLKVDITSTTTGAIFPASGSVSCIAVDPNNADNILVAFSNYSIYSLFYSSNGGTSWAKAAGNLEATATGTGNGPSIRWASIMPVSNGTVYMVAASTGLYATSFLSGTSTVWVQQGTSTIGNSVCDMIDYRTTDGLVVVATHSHGIYSSNITSTGDITSVNEIKKIAMAEMNVFPNPAIGDATIEINLSQNLKGELNIADELGRKIKTIATGEFKKGKNNVALQRNNLARGIYYCTFVPNKKQPVVKAIVLN